eukprot:TRINITY_DN3425_c1_g1_i3.p1 TRINITY_DN3425_c1_g1~~TRINITY_DN3425_c1_g1_i3.p1  ORF type:complete len:290 (-),score=52.69 TRINITY_DN3425_c1_g1_i3:210-1022(-)
MAEVSWQLVYRNCFIDSHAVELHRGKRRACSLPSREKPIDSHHEAAAAYVADFRTELDELGGPTSLQHHRGCGSAGDCTEQEKGSFSEAAPEAAAEHSGFDYPASEGSRGHPFLCTSPCSFLLQGHCKMGSDCSRCHWEHSKSNYLNIEKRDRQFLQRLTCAAILTVAIPLVHERLKSRIVKAKGTPAASQQLSMLQEELRDFLEASLAKAMSANPAVDAGAHRFRVKKIFSKTRLQYVFTLIIKSLDAEDKDAAKALQELVGRVRNLLP